MSESVIPPFAFPLHVPDVRGIEGQPIREGWTDNGMMLRDYFAAKVMQSLIPKRLTASCTSSSWFGVESQALAELAYGIADAMVAQREKGPSK